MVGLKNFGSLPQVGVNRIQSFFWELELDVQVYPLIHLRAGALDAVWGSSAGLGQSLGRIISVSRCCVPGSRTFFLRR